MNSRLRFIEFLCENRNILFDIEKTPRGEKIKWASNGECEVLQVFQSEKATNVLQELNMGSFSNTKNLQSRVMLDKYYNGICKQTAKYMSPYNTVDVEQYFEENFLSYVEPIECLFIYFYISESKEELRGLGLFEELFAAAGLCSGLESVPYIHNAVTYYVLLNKLGVEEWFLEQEKWLNIIIEPTLKLKDFVSSGELSYKEWYEGIVLPGLEYNENVKATRHSIQEINDEMKDWSKNSDLMPTMQKIVNTEARRRWYFCKLISDIVERQKEDKSLDELYSWISYGNINASGITAAFNDYFDGITNDFYGEMSAMAHIKVRLSRMQEEEDKSENNRHCLPTFTELVRNSDPSDRKRIVSRELLLMLVLLAMVYGVDIDKEEYVQQHVLYNSRFGIDFYDSRFDNFFEKTFDELATEKDAQKRVAILKKNAGEFEKFYLNMHEAIFNKYLLGKRYSYE